MLSAPSQVFDITRKTTYKNLAEWYKELREYREKIPCIVVANKIDGILFKFIISPESWISCDFDLDVL